MKKATLGGITWSYNFLSQDYCQVEAVNCLKELCDEVIVLDAGSTDGSAEILRKLEDDKVRVVLCDKEEWTKRRGREKLSFFQNLAMSFLTTDYYVALQADESLHENSFPVIRNAIETGCEGFYVLRINLWGSSKTQLNVPHERSPVGTNICRIAKVGYKSIDDAESIECPGAIMNFMENIRIYHAGFVRDKRVHVEKIRHMQQDVFEIDPDKKLEGMKEFDSTAWFTEKDLVPIKDELPKFVKLWAEERDKINTNQ